jgi:hypothetical protein
LQALDGYLVRASNSGAHRGAGKKFIRDLVRKPLPSAKPRRSGGPASTQNGANPDACVLRRGGVSSRNYRLVAPGGAQRHEGNDPPYVLQTPGMRHGHLAWSANHDAWAVVPP